MKLRSAFSKLKKLSGDENMLGICAALLILHLLYYIITSGDQYYLINPYEFGAGILTDLYMRAGIIAFKIIRAFTLAGALFVLFLFIRKILAKAEITADLFCTAKWFCLLLCVFPVFITGRVFSYSYTFSLQTVIIALTMICVMLLLDGKSRAGVLIICAVCELFYAGFIFTYFPAVLLILIYQNTAEISAAPARKKSKKAGKNNNYFPIALFITAAVIFILLAVLTPALNKSLRTILSPVFDSNDQTVLYDSIDETRRGELNNIIQARRLDYIIAVLPFLGFFSYVLISAARLSGKESKMRSRWFLMCLCAQLPAVAGVLFFRKISLWLTGAVFCQVLLMMAMIYKNDKTLSGVLLRVYERIKQNKIYIFLIILFMIALCCCFYERGIYEIVRSNSV